MSFFCANTVTRSTGIHQERPRKLIDILPWVWVVACYVASLVTFWCSPAGADSDFSSELILANLLNKTGGIMTSEWIYSTELRVLNTQIVYRIALLLFPSNWHLARTFAVAIFMLCLLFSAWALLRALDIRQKYGWIAGAFLLPTGSLYSYYYLWCSYYVPHICISLVAIAALIKTWSDRPHSCLWMVAGTLLAFASGLGGIRQVLVCYLPLWLAGIFMLIIDPPPCPNSHQSTTIRIVWNSTALLVACGVGYLINVHILSHTYSFYDLSERSLQAPLALSSIVDFALSACMETWGFQPAGNATGFSGVRYAVSFLFSLLIITSITYLVLLWKHKRLTIPQELLLACFLVGIGINAVAFKAAGKADYYYLSPVALLAYPLCAIALDHLHQEDIRPLLKPAFSVLFALLISVEGFNAYVLQNLDVYMAIPMNRAYLPAFRDMSSWLVEHGKTQGMATFWCGNILTELSNGAIEVWHYNPNVLDAPIHEEPDFYAWLQTRSHLTEPPEGSVFLVVTDEELANAGLAEINSTPEYESGNINVFTFDTYEQYLDAVIAQE